MLCCRSQSGYTWTRSTFTWFLFSRISTETASEAYCLGYYWKFNFCLFSCIVSCVIIFRICHILINLLLLLFCRRSQSGYIWTRSTSTWSTSSASSPSHTPSWLSSCWWRTTISRWAFSKRILNILFHIFYYFVSISRWAKLLLNIHSFSYFLLLIYSYYHLKVGKIYFKHIPVKYPVK